MSADFHKLKLEQLIKQIEQKLTAEIEVDAAMNRFSSQTFSAIHKGVTAHISGDNIRLEISDEAYGASKELLESAIPTAIRQAMDIRGAELTRVIEKLVNRAKEF